MITARWLGPGRAVLCPRGPYSNSGSYKSAAPIMILHWTGGALLAVNGGAMDNRRRSSSSISGMRRALGVCGGWPVIPVHHCQCGGAAAAGEGPEPISLMVSRPVVIVAAHCRVHISGLLTQHSGSLVQTDLVSNDRCGRIGGPGTDARLAESRQCSCGGTLRAARRRHPGSSGPRTAQRRTFGMVRLCGDSFVRFTVGSALLARYPRRTVLTSLRQTALPKGQPTVR